MATYKVLQDIEAEDKFLGPLTLKQFIFAAIALVSAYLSVIFLTKGLWVLVFPMVPVIIVTGFLAFPWGRDQPTEVWLLAKLRFMFKPRKRIWDQTGIQELVKITAPVQAQVNFSDNLSQTEVKSRLRALADTIDSRGWAIKSVNVADSMQLVNQSSDRLVAASTLPQTSSIINPDDGIADDMFESPKARQLTNQIEASSQQHKGAVAQNFQQNINSNPASGQPVAPSNLWFMNQPAPATPRASNMASPAAFGTQVTTPMATQDDTTALPSYARKPEPLANEDLQLLNKIHASKNREHESLRNHRTISPQGAVKAQPVPVTGTPDPVTIELARNNDRVVSSLARETNRLHPKSSDDEVVISLH